MIIKERNPMNNKILSFKSVIVYGECCWIFWKKKNGGPNFKALAPKIYYSDWSIKKVGVNNCKADHKITLKEETHCIADGCGKNKNENYNAYIHDKNTKSSSEPPDKSKYRTETTEGTYLTINPKSVTDKKARINEIKTESIKSSLSLNSHSTKKYEKINETTSNPSKHLEHKSDSAKSRSSPCIHYIIFICGLNLMPRF